MKKQLVVSTLLFFFHLTCFSDYYSQYNQDKIIHENYFWNQKSGVFVDIGAHNGITFSNSYFFEKELGWTGVCVEPIPEVFEELRRNRKCKCIQGCITDHEGMEQFHRVSSPVTSVEMLSGLKQNYSLVHLNRMKQEITQTGGHLESIDVKCFKLDKMVRKNKIKHINLLSIDTGGGEYAILSSIDFSKFTVDVITVEDSDNDPRFIPFLEQKGFHFAQRIEQDLLFVRNGFKPEAKLFKPKVSIITSINNGDEFIKGFLKDITEQTIFHECELILINANSKGSEEKYIKEYLAKYPNILYLKLPKDPGIYGVWNYGIKLASGKYVSNANLDDRSDPRALEILSKELDANPDIDLVYSGYLITEVPNDTYFKNHAKSHYNPAEFSLLELTKNCLPGPRPVWRKSMNEKYGYFDESFLASGDAEMWLRAACLGANFKKAAGLHTLHYINPKGLPANKDAQKLQERNLESERIANLYKKLFESLIASDKTNAFLEFFTLAFDQLDKQNLPLALKFFLKTYSVLPNRAEPLIEAAKISRLNGDSLVGYVLAKQATSYPCPKEDAFVDPQVYNYGALVELANCAFACGRFKEGIETWNSLLANPDLPEEYHFQIKSKWDLAQELAKAEAPKLN